MKIIHRIVCYFFGHDKYMPHPNKKIWYCARCENGPGDNWDRAMEKWRKNDQK